MQIVKGTLIVVFTLFALLLLWPLLLVALGQGQTFWLLIGAGIIALVYAIFRSEWGNHARH